MAATMVSTLPLIAEALPRVERQIRELVPTAGERLRSIVILTGTLALGGSLDREAVASAAFVEVLRAGMSVRAARRAIEDIPAEAAILVNGHSTGTADLYRLGCVLANHCARAHEEERMAAYGTAFGRLVQGGHDHDLARRAAEAVPDRDNEAAAILRELPAAYLNWATALIA